MRFLVIVKQKKNVDTFQDVIAQLLDAGHEVRLGVQEVEHDRRDTLAERFTAPGFQLVACPEGRGDEWRASAPLVRTVRDWAQYLRAPYRHASKLRARAAQRLAKDLGVAAAADAGAVLDPLQGARVLKTFELIEAAIPSDRLHEEFLARHAPDVLLVTPGVHFGSVQTDFIKSARTLGIPVWMLLFSWDNLSTKGALHVPPDLMFVWNERQRSEAAQLHDYPADRVVVVGASRFDEFFSLTSVVPRADFFKPLDLDPSAPTLLYVCSSRFIAERELPFIEQWLAALRASSSAALRQSNVIVRPHPDVALVDESADPSTVTWAAMPQASGWVQRPFGDPRAIVLRTTYRTQQAFYECLHHAAAVVGLNTSAELEAGIAGRPVFTLVSHYEGADGQSNTLHFEYLLREHGGFVVCAADMATHVAQLADALASPPDVDAIRSFIDAFLRPAGQGPVSALLARMLIAKAEQRVALRPDRSDSRRSDRPSTGGPAAPAIPADDDVGVPEEARKKVTLGYPGSTVRILATPETRRMRRKGVLDLDEATVAWLDQQVHPGDVMYDVGAGVGAYALVVAMHRGATCVAFEPGFASFKRLCDNLLLNGCSRSVIPLPIALGDRAGLRGLEYAGEAGGHGHSLTSREWRSGRDTIDAHYTQPVCAERLDEVAERHRLPRPHVMRIAVRRGATAVVRGADALLRDPALRSVLASVRGDEEADAVAQALQPYGFAVAAAAGNDRNRTVILLRTEALEGAGRAAGLLRRVTERMRPRAGGGG
jgi:FkbM family methyltransferase